MSFTLLAVGKPFGVSLEVRVDRRKTQSMHVALVQTTLKCHTSAVIRPSESSAFVSKRNEIEKDPRIHAVKWIAFAVPRLHYLLFPFTLVVAQFPGV